MLYGQGDSEVTGLRGEHQLRPPFRFEWYAAEAVVAVVILHADDEAGVRAEIEGRPEAFIITPIAQLLLVAGELGIGGAACDEGTMIDPGVATARQTIGRSIIVKERKFAGVAVGG